MRGKVKFLFNDSAHNVASVHLDSLEADDLIYFIYLFKKIFIQL